MTSVGVIGYVYLPFILSPAKNIWQMIGLHWDVSWPVVVLILTPQSGRPGAGDVVASYSGYPICVVFRILMI